MTSTTLKKISSFIRDNGFYAMVDEVSRRAAGSLRGRLMSFSMRSKGLRVGSRPYIRGTRHMRIGDNFHVGDDNWIEVLTGYRDQRFVPCLTVGANVSTSRWTHIACIDSVRIGDNTLIGSKVLITDHNHGAYSGPQQSLPGTPPSARALGGGGPVTIESNVWIGDNVSVLGPAFIGDGAVIAANSVVHGTIPAHTLAGGIPAKPLRRFNPSTRSWERHDPR